MLPFLVVLVVIAPVFLERAIRCMSASSHYFVERNATQKIDRYKCSSTCMTSNQLVFWDIFSLYHSIYFSFSLDFVVKRDSFFCAFEK